MEIRPKYWVYFPDLKIGCKAEGRHSREKMKNLALAQILTWTLLYAAMHNFCACLKFCPKDILVEKRARWIFAIWKGPIQTGPMF